MENETHKLLWDFETQIAHLISARQPDLVIINKNKREIDELLRNQQLTLVGKTREGVNNNNFISFCIVFDI